MCERTLDSLFAFNLSKEAINDEANEKKITHTHTLIYARINRISPCLSLFHMRLHIHNIFLCEPSLHSIFERGSDKICLFHVHFRKICARRLKIKYVLDIVAWCVWAKRTPAITMWFEIKRSSLAKYCVSCNRLQLMNVTLVTAFDKCMICFAPQQTARSHSHSYFYISMSLIESSVRLFCLQAIIRICYTHIIAQNCDVYFLSILVVVHEFYSTNKLNVVMWSNRKFNLWILRDKLGFSIFTKENRDTALILKYTHTYT